MRITFCFHISGFKIKDKEKWCNMGKFAEQCEGYYHLNIKKQ